MSIQYTVSLPLSHEFPPTTTRPGLQPSVLQVWIQLLHYGLMIKYFILVESNFVNLEILFPTVSVLQSVAVHVS